MTQEKRKAKTLRLRESTLERLATVAESIGAYQSPLVDQILTRAMDEIEAGNWKLKRRPVKYKVNLE